MESFKQWAVSNFSGKDTPEGDLAHDMAGDDLFPGGADHEAIRDYLIRRGACEGALEAFDRLWKRYRRTQR